MPRMFMIPVECGMCSAPGILVDTEEVAVGIARVEGKIWTFLSVPERDRYIELAKGALEGITA